MRVGRCVCTHRAKVTLGTPIGIIVMPPAPVRVLIWGDEPMGMLNPEAMATSKTTVKQNSIIPCVHPLQQCERASRGTVSPKTFAVFAIFTSDTYF